MQVEFKVISFGEIKEVNMVRCFGRLAVVFSYTFLKSGLNYLTIIYVKCQSNLKCMYGLDLVQYSVIALFHRLEIALELNSGGLLPEQTLHCCLRISCRHHKNAPEAVISCKRKIHMKEILLN